MKGLIDKENRIRDAKEWQGGRVGRVSWCFEPVNHTEAIQIYIYR